MSISFLVIGGVNFVSLMTPATSETSTRGTISTPALIAANQNLVPVTTQTTTTTTIPPTVSWSRLEANVADFAAHPATRIPSSPVCETEIYGTSVNCLLNFWFTVQDVAAHNSDLLFKRVDCPSDGCGSHSCFCMGHLRVVQSMHPAGSGSLQSL